MKDFPDLSHVSTYASRSSPRKGPVKLIQRVKTAQSFLQSVSNLFHSIILSLPICNVVLHYGCQRIFSKLTSKNGEIGRFNRSLLIDSFYLTLKFHSFIPSNMKSSCRIFIHS